MNLQIVSTVLATLSGVWLATTLATSALYPFYTNKLQAVQPAQRAWVLRLIALTPTLLSSLACIELFVVPGEIVPLHCHLSNCAAHDPDIRTSSSLLTGLLLLALCLVALLALKVIWDTATLARRWRCLSTNAGNYRYLDFAQPIACILGMLRPTIYFSRGFIAQLSPTALQVVIAHEQAHAARYDNIWAALIRIFSFGWFNRKLLANDLELAQEQACDLYAAQVAGDAITVAETLLQCQRLIQECRQQGQRLTQTPQVACAFLRGQLAARVQALLEPQQTTLAPLVILRFGSLALMLVPALVIPLHYFIELI